MSSSDMLTTGDDIWPIDPMPATPYNISPIERKRVLVINPNHVDKNANEVLKTSKLPIIIDYTIQHGFEVKEIE